MIIGAGAAGMAFADSLITHSHAAVVMVDRRHQCGGHWNDAYPFVRLHQPSAFYGVNSRLLGHDALDGYGLNSGMYERASGPEICDYFERVLREHLLPTGRVRFFGMCDYVSAASGRHQLQSRLTPDVYDVTVRHKIVDARYLEPRVPSTHSPSFHVEPSVRLIPVNRLVDITEPFSKYVLIGGGKTGMDACIWLLENGVDPDRIRWIRPRDSWLLNREGFQPLEQVASSLEGLALDVEAAARADSVEDLFQRLESCGRMIRIDEQVVPTMYRCATVSRPEVTELRRVTDVVRLGRVLRIGPDQILLEQAAVPTSLDHLHIDCTAAGLPTVASRPIFETDRITLQQVRSCAPTFNAALIGYVEATRHDIVEQNRLCPPNPLPNTAMDWLRNLVTSQAAASTWAGQPDVRDWLEGSRLNLYRGIRARAQETRVSLALQRFGENRKSGLARLNQLIDSHAPAIADSGEVETRYPQSDRPL